MNDLISACIDSDHSSQRISIALNGNHSLFEEHFPNNPTFPGALTIAMVLGFARQFFEKNKILGYELECIERVSLIKRIVPTRKYFLECTYRVEEGSNVMRLMFAALDSADLKTEYTRGVLVYRKIGCPIG